MPREQINYPGAYYEADPKTGASSLVAPADAALHVSWDVHGTLQIGYETDRDTAAAMVKDPGVPTSGESQDADRITMYTPVLDRHEVNKLIRTLRRARDHAYGKDE